MIHKICLIGDDTGNESSACNESFLLRQWKLLSHRNPPNCEESAVEKNNLSSPKATTLPLAEHRKKHGSAYFNCQERQSLESRGGPCQNTSETHKKINTFFLSSPHLVLQTFLDIKVLPVINKNSILIYQSLPLTPPFWSRVSLYVNQATLKCLGLSTKCPLVPYRVECHQVKIESFDSCIDFIKHAICQSKKW